MELILCFLVNKECFVDSKIRHLACRRDEHARIDVLHSLEEGCLILRIEDVNLDTFELGERSFGFFGEDEGTNRCRLPNKVLSYEKKFENESPGLALRGGDENLAFPLFRRYLMGSFRGHGGTKMRLNLGSVR
jgi:hypothetical protein